MIEALLIILMIFSGAGILYSITVGKRNEKLGQYLHDCLDKVKPLARRDISMNRDWEWRYDKFGEAHENYAIFVWQIWRPIDSIFPDKKFMEDMNN